MNKHSYKKFAGFYDEINGSDFYDHYTLFIKKIIKNNYIKEVKILDLACGTGRLIQLLKPFCATIHGADLSQEMLKIAKNKDKKIKYYHQSFLNLDTKNKYNIIVSTFDSINYLTDEKQLTKAFNKVMEHLLDGGIFIFDFNTIHKKVKKIIKKNEIVYDSLIKGRNWIITISKANGKNNFKEYHRERLYSFNQIKSALGENDLQIICIYSDFDNKIKKTSKEPRIFLVAKKIWP